MLSNMTPLGGMEIVHICKIIVAKKNRKNRILTFKVATDSICIHICPHINQLNSIIQIAPFPYSLSHHTFPFISSISFFTMNSPKPVEDSSDVGCALRRANLPNSCFLSSSFNPGPSSFISHRTFPSILWIFTYTFLFRGEYFIAFDIRFSSICLEVFTSPKTIHSPSRGRIY